MLSYKCNKKLIMEKVYDLFHIIIFEKYILINLNLLDI
jgi:hypothetical protein